MLSARVGVRAHPAARVLAVATTGRCLRRLLVPRSQECSLDPIDKGRRHIVPSAKSSTRTACAAQLAAQ